MKRIITLFVLFLCLAANALAIEYEIVNTISQGWYKSYIVKYRSVSADMTGTEMVSGVVTVPTFGGCNCLLLDNHHTISSNAEAPSVQGVSAAGQLFSLAYVVAATDYIGYGATADKVHPYLCARQNAQNSIDMALVAWDIIEKEGIKLTHEKLLNMGYSQGGGVALAVHREMERNPALAEKLHFGGSWCGDGPYDVKSTMQEYLSHPDKVTYPLGLPMLVNGFLSGAPAELKGDLKFSDFITDEMVEAGLESMLASKELDSEEINEKMKAAVGGRELKLSDIFKPEMASLDGVLAKKYQEFAESDLLYTGWTPTYPLRLIHLSCDEVVPVVNASNAIEGLQLNSEQYVFDDRESTHADYGMTFYLNIVNELYAFDFDQTNAITDVQEESVCRPAVKRLENNRIVIERNGRKYDLSGTSLQ